MAMSQRLNGKVAVVTASTAGIGLAIARRLGLEGASIMVSSRKQDRVDSAVAALKEAGLKNVAGTKCHVADANQRKALIDTAVAKFGKIDILVSNAGTNPHFGSILEISESSWDKIFDTNLKASFFLIRDAVPHMNKNGSIIFVSSITGYVPEKTIGAYSVSKTALLGLTKVLSDTLAPESLRVNCIAPGIIRTDFAKVLVETPEIHDSVLEKTPLGRIGEPDDIAGAAAFLASSDSGYMTGETLVIAGGTPSHL